MENEITNSLLHFNAILFLFSIKKRFFKNKDTLNNKNGILIILDITLLELIKTLIKIPETTMQVIICCIYRIFIFYFL